MVELNVKSIPLGQVDGLRQSGIEPVKPEQEGGQGPNFLNALERAIAPRVLHHTPLLDVSDEAVARLLSGFDVVLDGSGHTTGNRLGALARRPAPVATSVLGFAGSYGGARLVDYLTSDRIVVMGSGATRTR